MKYFFPSVLYALLNECVNIEYYVFIINAILSFFRLPVVFLVGLSSSLFVANICSFVCLFVCCLE